MVSTKQSQIYNTAIIAGMRMGFFTLVLAAILLAACGAGSAENGIEVDQVKVGAGAQGEDRAVYLAMRNRDSEPDLLTGASSDAAAVAQLQNGTQAVAAIPVQANTEFVFIPDGYHVMLIGLKQELHVGDEIEVVLQFRDHEDMTIKVPVQEAMDHEHDH
jgi:periplasmic copper chaperone A